jgi:hypothetical protein
VLYHVERGVLGFWIDGRRLVTIETGSSDHGQARNRGHIRHGRENTIEADVVLYGEDRLLGPIRNAGSDQLVVLALLVVPEPGLGEIDSGGREATAVPDMEVTPVEAKDVQTRLPPRRKGRA